MRLTLLHYLPLVDHYFHPSGRVGLTETPVAPKAGETGLSMVSVAAKTAPLAAVSEDLHGRVSSHVSFISRVASGLAVTFATAVFHAFTDPGIDQALDDQHAPRRPARSWSSAHWRSSR